MDCIFLSPYAFHILVKCGFFFPGNKSTVRLFSFHLKCWSVPLNKDIAEKKLGTSR